MGWEGKGRVRYSDFNIRDEQKGEIGVVEFHTVRAIHGVHGLHHAAEQPSTICGQRTRAVSQNNEIHIHMYMNIQGTQCRYIYTCTRATRDWTARGWSISHTVLVHVLVLVLVLQQNDECKSKRMLTRVKGSSKAKGSRRVIRLEDGNVDGRW